MTRDEHRDPRIDPRPGDRLFNHTRTVIFSKGEKVIFGVDIGDAKNCGAYSMSLDEWRAWAAHSYDEAVKP